MSFEEDKTYVNEDCDRVSPEEDEACESSAVLSAGLRDDVLLYSTCLMSIHALKWICRDNSPLLKKISDELLVLTWQIQYNMNAQWSIWSQLVLSRKGLKYLSDSDRFSTIIRSYTVIN